MEGFSPSILTVGDASPRSLREFPLPSKSFLRQGYATAILRTHNPRYLKNMRNIDKDMILVSRYDPVKSLPPRNDNSKQKLRY